MSKKQKENHCHVGFFREIFSNNELCGAYGAVEQLLVTSKQSRSLSENAFQQRAQPDCKCTRREKRNKKLNSPNLYPGTDSFIFESLAVSHANKKLLKGGINTEQVCARAQVQGFIIGRQRLRRRSSYTVYRVMFNISRRWRDSRCASSCLVTDNLYIQQLTKSSTLFIPLSSGFSSAHIMGNVRSSRSASEPLYLLLTSFRDKLFMSQALFLGRDEEKSS